MCQLQMRPITINHPFNMSTSNEADNLKDQRIPFNYEHKK